MRIDLEAALTDQERDEVKGWAKAHRTDDIDSISVHERVVWVHRSEDHLTATVGTALRQGDMRGELTLPLANLNTMHTTPSRPVARPWRA